VLALQGINFYNQNCKEHPASNVEENFCTEIDKQICAHIYKLFHSGCSGIKINSLIYKLLDEIVFRRKK
jgi:hypothetical protein